MGELSEQNRALIARETNSTRARWWADRSGIAPELNRLLDAARTEGRGEGEPVAWRPEVRAFADLMESQLRANDHKPGWKRDFAGDLFRRLHEEADELGREIFHSVERAAVPGRIAKEAADVANFAMMIADVFGALDQPLYASPIREPEISSARREEIARLVWFVFGDDMSAKAAMDPKNDAHWASWRGEDAAVPAFNTADAILNLAPVGGRGEGWRPIETAPKDGTHILAFKAGWGPTEAHWEASNDPEDYQGWIATNQDTDFQPTHWQPLPPPPQEQGGMK